jgi:hypothetical protein
VRQSLSGTGSVFGNLKHPTTARKKLCFRKNVPVCTYGTSNTTVCVNFQNI